MVFATSIISVAFMGRLGKASLGAGVLASSFANVSGFSILTGLASTTETFCGQSYGARQFRLVGVYFQRCLLITLLTSVPIAALWLASPALLKALGQDPLIAEMAGTYLRALVPALPLFAVSESLRKYLMSQSLVHPVMWSSGVVLVLCPILNYVLIVGMGMRLVGAALALVGCHLVAALFLLAYTFGFGYKHVRQCWCGWLVPEALQEWGAFLHLAVPSTAMLALEWA